MAQIIRANGFTRVWALKGGYAAWQMAGLAVEQKE
ncbi:MAG: rhodanese-like domain-containing protein [Desulfuromonadales bacterium]|nr:rhodanese-like domain-containing protein [Desulfuromonadales bacterium]